MDFEQILIRLGLDAKAVTAGLTRVTSFVKGWATGLVHDLQHHVIGRLAGLVIFERLFDGIKEKALFVQRTAKETGLSTNMIQGMANELGYVGEGFEGLGKPLGKFNELIGKAKMGSIEARTKLMDLGIVSKGEEINTLNLTRALARAKAEFDKIGDASVRAARMEEMFGKQWERLMPLLELSQKQFAALDKPNFFTKLQPGTLNTFSELTRSAKGTGNAFVATAGNLFNVTLGSIIRGMVSNTRFKELSKEIGRELTIGEELNYIFKGQLPALVEAKNLAHETTESYLKRKEIAEEIEKLENRIGDRTKLTVEGLANRARAILGDKMPRGIEGIHAITPAMAGALRIQKLEDAAQVATARGQFGRAEELQSRADVLRSSNFALKSTERDPMKEVNNRLDIINDSLTRAGIVVKDLKTPNH